MFSGCRRPLNWVDLPLGNIHISGDAPPGREGLIKSVIILSSEGGRGLTKVSPDIEREMGVGKEEEELELEEEK